MTVTSSPFRLVHLTTQLSEMGYFIVSAGSEWCCKGEGVGDLIAGILASQGYQRLLNQSGFCDVWISPLKDREITVKATRCMANLVEAELRVEAAAFPVTDWSLSSSKAFPDYIKLSSSAIKSWPNSKHLIAFSTQHAHVASFLVKNSLAEECIIVAGSFLSYLKKLAGLSWSLFKKRHNKHWGSSFLFPWRKMKPCISYGLLPMILKVEIRVWGG